MTNAVPLPVDPGTLIRSRRYRVLLVLAAIIGLIVSLASWGFLGAGHELPHWVFTTLPGELGFD